MKNKELCRLIKMLKLANDQNIISISNIETIKINKCADKATVSIIDNQGKSQNIIVNREDFEKYYSLKWN